MLRGTYTEMCSENTSLLFERKQDLEPRKEDEDLAVISSGVPAGFAPAHRNPRHKGSAGQEAAYPGVF